MILALDTWIYGGLIFSRKSRDSFEVCLERLSLLEHLVQQFKTVQFYGFATLMRLSNSNDATEEQAYWADYGAWIYRYSYLEHFLSVHSDPTLEREWLELQPKIPSIYREDYRQLRERNFRVLESLLTLVTKGIFCLLYLGHDDSGQWGWNVQERLSLKTFIIQKQLQTCVLMYPGADELACTLTIKALLPSTLPLQILHAIPHSEQHITLYEGIPLKDTLAYQAKAVGFELTHRSNNIFAIYSPPFKQQDCFLERESVLDNAPTPFINQVKEHLSQKQVVTIADIHYANGGILWQSLLEDPFWIQLAGYTAWNTTGNTLGMALAWLKAYLNSSPATYLAHLTFLLERLADDGLYQGYLRQKLCEHYSQPVTEQTVEELKQLFHHYFERWAQDLPSSLTLHLKHLSFPWNRFFEIDLQLSLP